MGKKRLVRILPIMDSEKFEHWLAQNLEPLDTEKHVGFPTGLQTDSFPLIVGSHTWGTSSMCIVHNSNILCLRYNSSDQMDLCTTLMFSSEWLCETETLVNIRQRKEVNCKRLQSNHCPSLGLSVFHKFSLTSTVHIRGHSLAAAKVVMLNGYCRGPRKYPENTHQQIFTKVLSTWNNNL
jgi:hypothetical protein